MGFEKTLNLAQQSQKTLEFTSVTCDADNLATDQSYLTSTHTNCLIQLLKNVPVKPFVSTEAAHSTAALHSVKLFFEFVSGETLFYSTTCASDQTSFSSAGGAFYSVQNRCQHLFFTAFDHQDRNTEKPSNPAFRCRRILLESATVATLYFHLTH